MSINKLLLPIVALSLVSNSHASLIGWEIIPGADQHPDGLHDTWQIIMVFNDANDKLLRVAGLPDKGGNEIHFHTGGGELYNQAFGAGDPLNDFPSVALGGEAYDSYVTMGAVDFPHNTQFTDDFLGDWGGNPPPVQVILGSSFDSSGGWFHVGDPPPVSFFDIIPDNDTFEVVIAQFTVDKGVGIRLEGLINWQDAGGGGGVSTNFFVDNTPAPGAAALLGFAAFTVIRRRRS